MLEEPLLCNCLMSEYCTGEREKMADTVRVCVYMETFCSVVYMFVCMGGRN